MEEEIKSSGYVVDTLEADLWCLLNTDSYKTLALKAVNLGSSRFITASALKSFAEH